MNNLGLPAIFLITFLCGCSFPENNKITQLETGDYWIDNFRSGDYSAKIYNNDRVYCSSLETSSDLPNYIYCFNLLTGKVEWRTKVKSWATFSPIILDSTIYFCTYLGDVYSLSKNGELRWNSKVRGGYAGHRINSMNNNLFVSTVSGGVNEFDYLTGEIVNHAGEGTLDVALPIISDSLICYGNIMLDTVGITGNNLICLNYFTKDTIWTRSFDWDDDRQPYYRIDELYLKSNKIYIVEGDSNFTCLSLLTGDIIWTNKIERSFDEKVVFRNENVFVKTRNSLYSFNQISGMITDNKFEKLEKVYNILKKDSTYCKVYCQDGSFLYNGEYDNSCELRIEHNP